MNMKKILILSLVSLFVFAFFAAAIAAETRTVTLNISPGQWVAEQHIGVINVPQGSTASNFMADITVYDEHGKAIKYPTFIIQKRTDDGNYTTVFEQTWQKYEWDKMSRVYKYKSNMYVHEKKLVENPVPLSQLTLEPGRYVVTMGGYGGSALKLTYSLQP